VKPKSVYRPKGLTLVELLLSMALMSIIMVSISSLFLIQYRSASAEIKKAEMQANARQSINMIISDLRRSEAESSIYDENGVLKKIADSEKLIINNEIIYYVDNNVLKRNGVDVCKNIKKFSILERSENGVNVIDIDITIGIGNITKDDILVNGSYRRKLSNRE